VEREGGRSSVLHELAPEKDGGARISPLWVSAVGLARAGTGDGWRRSDLAALDLKVGRDSGWKAACLA
jgi:hypothetical protein